MVVTTSEALRPSRSMPTDMSRDQCTTCSPKDDFAFWPFDYGRRSAARKATACASLRAQGSHGFRYPFFSLPGWAKTVRPDLCASAALMPADISSARKAKEQAATATHRKAPQCPNPR
jgi:hypothetical protein